MKKRSNQSLGRLSADDFVVSAKLPVCFVLDNVRSTHNVGSVFRTADAFRLGELLLCGITASPPHKDIRKTALGAEKTVAWQKFSETIQAIEQLKSQGWTVYAVEQVEEAVLLQNLKLPSIQPNHSSGGYAFVFGHEVDGISQSALDACHASVEIEQSGSKHSLNISVCAGIVAWHAHSQLKGVL